MFALVAFAAFEATAVTTVMPTVARELDGIGLYALSFAAPLASGVVGMVAAGARADRRGPVGPLVVALVLFALGLVVCGTAPSMEVLVAGRVLQGLGGGAMTVCLYVVVGLVFPAVLQPAVFASFAAAWVLPSLFGPALAAFVAHAVGWRWVFLGVVALVAASTLLIAPALRGLEPRDGGRRSRRGRGWSGRSSAPTAVLALELLGSRERRRRPARRPRAGRRRALAAPPAAGRAAARPARAARGDRHPRPAERVVLLRRGLHRLRAPGALGPHPRHRRPRADRRRPRLGRRPARCRPGSATGSPTSRAMRWGTALVLVGTVGARRGRRRPTAHPALAMAAYVVAGAGMGFGYPRTGVAMLAASTDADRGFNSSALSIADSLGGALSLSLSGIVFGVATRAGRGPVRVGLRAGDRHRRARCRHGVADGTG